MATSSSMGFHQATVPSSSYNRHLVCFQPGLVCSSTSMFPTSMTGFVGVNNTTGMIFTGDTCVTNNKAVSSPVGNTVGDVHLDPVPGLKYDTGFAADWSVEELAFLEEGLVKYAHEPNIMKYIKIAAMLQDKTVRDVALRCCWMMKKNGKRRKQEECHTGKKMKDKKEKQVECSSRMNISSQLPNVASCSFMMHHMGSSNGISVEGPVVDGATQYLLEENAQVLGQIKVNLDNLKLQDNIELFFCTKNNIASILNRMSEMPGIMSQMPPLPVSINEELVSAMFLGTPQDLMFGAPDIIHLKQELPC